MTVITGTYKIKCPVVVGFINKKKGIKKVYFLKEKQNGKKTN